MTAAVFNIAEQQVIIAMDTLAMTGKTGKPYFFTSKFFLLPHLHGVMFGTGIGTLAIEWYAKLIHFVARDVHHLDQYVTPDLQLLGDKFGLDKTQTTTIYHVGYSSVESRYVAFAYRSSNSFASERLQYGLYTKPRIPDASVSSFPEDFVRLVSAQRDADAALPIEERVFIGGEIQAVVLQAGTMTVHTLHRFPDYESLYEQMCDELPANKA